MTGLRMLSPTRARKGKVRAAFTDVSGSWQLLVIPIGTCLAMIAYFALTS
jgi:hypothetical protein